jgi:molecular chaperone HtpG
MTQNAHDSCVRRRQEDRAVGKRYMPAIHVRIHPASQQLTIEDNGSGLTREEIQTFLATVGRGYTSELRERLRAAGRDEAMELIGLFGLGQLSACMIALRIEIVTVSYQEPERGWRWVSEGGQSYGLRAATRDEVGTTVRRDLHVDAKFLLDEAVLKDILTVYAEFLPIPIFVGDGKQPINGTPAPWTQGQDAEAGQAQTAQYTAWVEQHRGARPLTVVPLADAMGPDGQTIAMRGVL